jgi:hypothetical protein
MADDVAALGISVDTSGADQKVKDLSTSLDGLKKSAQGTAEPIGAIEAAAKRAGVSLDDMRQRMASASSGAATFGTGLSNAGTAIGDVNAAISQSPGTWSSLAAALGVTTGSLGANANAAKALAAEHRAASAVGTEFREVIHTLGPALEQAGLQMSSLTQFSGAARGGLAALAAAIGGGVVLEMAKAAGETDNLKTRLDGLAGIKMGDQLFNDLKNVSTELGIVPKSVEPALESLIKFQQQVASSGTVTLFGPEFTSGLNEAQLGGRNLTGIVKTLFEELRIGGANTKDATAEVNAFFAQVTKNGELTADTFKKLQDVAPAVAEALARALNNSSAGDFVKKLEVVPDTLSRVADALRKLEPAADAGFKRLIDDPKNIGDAFDKLKTKAEDLWKTIAGESSGDSATKFVSNVGDKLKTLEDALDKNKQSAGDWSGGWVGYFKAADEGSSASMGSMVTAIKKFNADGSEELRQFNQGVIDWAKSVVSAIESAAAAVANAVKNTPSAVNAAGGAGGTEGLGMGAFSDPNAQGGQLAGILSPSGDAGTLNLGDLGGGSGGATDNIPAFASGTDNAPGGLTRINETGGEIINLPSGAQVIPHDISMQMAAASGGIQGLTTIQGQSAIGAISATPDPASIANIKQITDAIDQSTIDISKQVLTGSDNIVNVLNKLIGGVAATTVNPATGLPVATTAATALGALGAAGTTQGAAAMGGGAGGFNTKSGGGMGDQAAKDAAQNAKDNPPLTPQQYYGNPAYGYPGGAFGQAVPIKGAGPLPGTTLPRREPISRVPSNPSGIAQQYSGGSAGQPINSPVSNYDGTDSLSGMLSNIGGGMSDFYGTDSAGSGMLSGSLSDIGGGTSDFFGTDSSGSGSISGSLSGIGSTDVPAGSGGIEGFAGSFAKGTSFVVGGDGGIDTTPISFNATKGEHVLVVPKDIASPAINGLSNMPAGNIPSGIAVPQSASVGNPTTAAASSDASQSSTTTTMTKNITINVAGPVQAQDFLKSRAQIARGM